MQLPFYLVLIKVRSVWANGASLAVWNMRVGPGVAALIAADKYTPRRHNYDRQITGHT